MIDVAISYGFGDENRYNLESIPESIQLALYKYDLYVKYKDRIWEAVQKNNTKIKVIHLPLDSLKRDFEDTYQIMLDGLEIAGCTHYVIHPNKFIEKYVDTFLSSNLNVKLCIENFQWRVKKVFRSPLDIIKRCLTVGENEGRSNLSMTLDTSHTDDIWFDHRIIPFLLKHTSVIHLSNRAKGHGSHMPFNSPDGELNLVGFVNDVRYRYKWNGIIVLEYMEMYQDKIVKNYEYLKRLVE